MQCNAMQSKTTYNKAKRGKAKQNETRAKHNNTNTKHRKIKQMK